MDDRRLRNSPVFPAIRRMKHSRNRAARAEPDIVFVEGRNAGAAGSESAFTGQRCRHGFSHHWIPGHAVRGRDQRELAVHRITYGDSVCAVPEGKAIVKSFGIAIGELPLPDLAAVSCLINARLIARADTEHERGVLVEGLNVAKVESVSVCDDQCLPVLPPSMVRKTVPLAPLAQATLLETALMPRSWTSVLLFCGCCP